MKKYFGTDGIRGVFGEFLTLDLARSVARAFAKLRPNAKIIIGRDTRESGAEIAKIFCDELNAVDIGIATTPMVSFLTKTQGFDFGIVITASHNTHEYNGIKFFGSDGKKISDELEMEIEKLI